MPSVNNKPTVIVAGGGLAGMTVAKELAEHGFSVRLLESSNRLGGKAGSEPGDPDGNPGQGKLYEHGYHIFAPWYENMLEITGSLGIELIPVYKWHYKAVAAGWKGLFLPASIGEIVTVLRNSPLPAPDTLLYFYFVLDMIAARLSRKAALDRISRLGLMRTRWYATRRLPEIEGESILKAAAVPVHEMSAYTAKILSSYFLGAMKPFRRQASLMILPGDLQKELIEPYRRAVEKAGVQVLFGHEAVRVELSAQEVEPKTIGKMYVRHRDDTGKATETAFEADAYVIATPLDTARALLQSGELCAVEPSIGRINHLRTAPMAALQLLVANKPDNLPKEHCFLMGGEYGLSFIDLTEHWKEDLPYNLSFISSNFAPLQNLDRKSQYRLLLREIQQYLPIRDQDVVSWSLFPNTGPGKQLFVNTVGSWPNRPTATCSNVSNLFFAGDWVQNRIDLACMEGAVWSARKAAQKIGERWSGRPGVKTPKGPHTAFRYPPFLIRLAVWALAPLAALVWLWAKLSDRGTRVESH